LRKKALTLERVFIYAVLVVICIFSLFPIIWAIGTSFKNRNQIYALPPEWLPNPITLGNYINVIINSEMPRFFMNTAIISVGATLISLTIGIMAAYGFSRYKFPGAKTLLWSILFTRILPRVTLIIPFYIILKNLRLVNTYPGLILVYLMVVMPISVWLLKGFFDNVPREIEEAAVVDGCSSINLLLRIVIPISLPAIVAVGMYTFILAWNEFLFALLMTTDAKTRTISVALAFYIDETGIHWGPLMAASVLMSIPAAIVFSISQRHLVRGLSEGAVKG
jgi:ABC-type glycerol-3-phosphate transport system permease component